LGPPEPFSLLAEDIDGNVEAKVKEDSVIELLDSP